MTCECGHVDDEHEWPNGACAIDWCPCVFLSTIPGSPPIMRTKSAVDNLIPIQQHIAHFWPNRQRAYVRRVLDPNAVVRFGQEFLDHELESAHRQLERTTREHLVLAREAAWWVENSPGEDLIRVDPKVVLKLASDHFPIPIQSGAPGMHLVLTVRAVCLPPFEWRSE